MTWFRRFGMFWYDFLVGERWELFVGPILALALAALLVGSGAAGVVVGLVLFASVVAVAAVSVATSLR
jgi:hypothetical protein